MGSTKDYWFDRVEAQKSFRLANHLGISEDELEQIAYDIDADYSSDGLLYGYIVRFDDDNDPSIMAKIEGLTSGSYVNLSPWDLEDPEEDELEWEVKQSDQLKMFNKQLAEIPEMLLINTTGNAQFSLFVMLHAHVVSALEHFLSTTFIHRVTNSDQLTRKLVESDPEFGNRKFTVNEIYAQHSNIKLTVAAYLKGIIFHEMRKVKPMYAEVLSFDFGDISWLFAAVRARHDCVHRAGYDKEGNPVTLSAESIRDLIKNCRELAERVDEHVQELEN
ncbi:hypothetical protein EIK76_06780 [Rheinheimera mesophila]|uniref:RiboL-PSP-HEPN domain-containing protein n=1 Tax=Rheinheimera mesophila TaxID=1547515 RepID=A0A3P3QR61_9GAMM|nr:hypothetical protein [Rheinheimera mesophila]RRJ23756.1 hypothetical protein EIK76_06780 [Rheinheimera mesophila]